MKPTLITQDFTAEFNRVVSKFKRDAVLVGVPEKETDRKGTEKEKEGPIGNAALLAINHFGSPENKIPPRPVLAIGIKKAQDEITLQFKLAAQQALTRGIAALPLFYNRAGIIASTAVKQAINDQIDIQGPADSTLAARKAAGFKGTKSLIVTGQLRNSITYVIREEE